MELSDLQELFEEARKRTNHTEFVVVGSLSILGLVQGSEIPERMTVSIDVDCYTLQDPGRVFELNIPLGQGSAFENEHGYYLDPIAPEVLTLPENWKQRLIRVPLPGSDVTVFFLDPNDAAVSKYARCEQRDREWIQAGLAARLLSAAIIRSRFHETEFADAAEGERALAAFSEDTQNA